MALDERTRHTLHVRLMDALGSDAAEALMAEIVDIPTDVARTSDIQEVRGEIAAMRLEMETMRYEIIAAFRGELVAAVSGQTKTLIFAVLGSQVVFGGTVLGAALMLS